MDECQALGAHGRFLRRYSRGMGRSKGAMTLNHNNNLAPSPPIMGTCPPYHGHLDPYHGHLAPLSWAPGPPIMGTWPPYHGHLTLL